MNQKKAKILRRLLRQTGLQEERRYVGYNVNEEGKAISVRVDKFRRGGQMLKEFYRHQSIPKVQLDQFSGRPVVPHRTGSSIPRDNDPTILT